MKIAESKSSTTAQHLQTQTDVQAPFFQQERNGHFMERSSAPFFSRGGTQQSFFIKPTIQTKLTIGQPGDKYEQEADQMADQVVQRLSEHNAPPQEPIAAKGQAGLKIQRKPIFESNAEPTLQAKFISSITQPIHRIQTKCAECEKEEQLQKMEKPGEEESLQRKPIFHGNAEPPEPPIQTKLKTQPGLQKKCAACAAEEEMPGIQRQANTAEPASATPSLESRLSSSRGGGSPLPDHARTQMEGAFGTDFSGVQVHTDSSAVQMNQELGAQAFTHGSDVYFNAGKYDTGSREGKRLLGHELTHVVQQGGGNDIVQRATQRCPNHRSSGEIVRSLSPQGILPNNTQYDTSSNKLYIHDFGVERSELPAGITQSDEWRRMMSMILGDSSAQLAVLGYSDCLGSEQRNRRLRNRRVESVIRVMPDVVKLKVSPIFRGSWGSLEYLSPNDNVENRAKNRAVVITLIELPHRTGADSCDVIPRANNIDEYLFLVRCLERRLGLTNAGDAHRTLSVLRQIYYGNAPWSSPGNRNAVWDDVIPDRPWSSGDDPTPMLGANLFNALRESQEVSFGGANPSSTVDIGHLLTGLDAMMNPQEVSVSIGSRLRLQTNVLNHAWATWAGDVGSAAANHTACVPFLNFTGSYDDFFRSFAGNTDLEVDIDAYALRTTLTQGPNTSIPLQLNTPLSEVLMQYYRLNNSTAGQARSNRFEIFANFYGGNVQAGLMQNRLAFKQNIFPAISEFAFLFFGNHMKEILQGNGAILNSCMALGIAPQSTNQSQRAVDLGNLLAELLIACNEMTERFTIWIEQRL